MDGWFRFSGGGSGIAEKWPMLIWEVLGWWTTGSVRVVDNEEEFVQIWVDLEQCLGLF